MYVLLEWKGKPHDCPCGKLLPITPERKYIYRGKNDPQILPNTVFYFFIHYSTTLSNT